MFFRYLSGKQQKKAYVMAELTSAKKEIKAKTLNQGSSFILIKDTLIMKMFF